MSKPITFPLVPTTGTHDKIRRNAETGVEIYKAGSWFVDYPTQNKVAPSWTEGPFDSLAAATAAAKVIVERHRVEIAAAFDEATTEDENREVRTGGDSAVAPVAVGTAVVPTSDGNPTGIAGSVTAVEGVYVTVEWSDSVDGERGTSGRDRLPYALFVKNWRYAGEVGTPVAYDGKGGVIIPGDRPCGVELQTFPFGHCTRPAGHPLNDGLGHDRPGSRTSPSDAEQARKIVESLPAEAKRIPEVAELAHRAEHTAKTPAEALEIARQAQQVAERGTTEPARQFCRKGIHPCTPAVTLTFDRGDRVGRLHWCAEHAGDAEQYRAQSREADQGDAPLPICLRVDGLHVAHMSAVTAECRDEQAGGDCRTCGRPAVVVDGQAEHVDPPSHVNGIHSADLPDAPAPQPHPPLPVAGDEHATHFGSDYLLPVCEVANEDPTTVAFNVDRVDCPVCLRWIADHPDEVQRFADESQPSSTSDLGNAQLAVYGVMATSSTPGLTSGMVADQLAAYVAVLPLVEVTDESGHGSTALHELLETVTRTPAAPADLNDDEAWQQYVATTPTPTTDEYAAVIAEFGVSPYAARIDECAQHFRATARELWSARREGTLTDELYAELRGSMRVARECLAVYRRLTAAWARRAADDLATA